MLLSSNIREWVEELCRLFPKEAEAIQRLTADALKLFRRIPDTPRKPNDMLTRWEKLRIGLTAVLNMRLYRKYMGISIQDLLMQEFRDPQVRTFFYSLCPVAAISLLF